jgi:hypothetical protein
MKHLFKSSLAILIGLSFTVVSCSKDDTGTGENNNNNGGNGGIVIPQEQKATVIYFGGTWCPPCGSAGKPAKEQIKAANPGKANIMSCQVGNDPMTNADANAMNAVFKPSGVPAMYIGASDDQISAMVGVNPTTALNIVTTQIAKTAKANFLLTATDNNDGLITLKVNGKFFADATDEYTIGGYLLEGKLSHTQASDASVEKNIHHDVLRAKFGDKILGEVFATAPKKDQTFEQTMNFFIQPTFKKENCSIMVIVWKKSGTQYTINNSTTIKLK